MNILLIQCLKRSKKVHRLQKMTGGGKTKGIVWGFKHEPTEFMKERYDFFLNNHRKKQNHWLFGIPEMGLFAGMILYIDL